MSRITLKHAARMLRTHFNNGGTLNDSVTDEIYRFATGHPDAEDTDLETVEQWAVEHAATFSVPVDGGAR